MPTAPPVAALRRWTAAFGLAFVAGCAGAPAVVSDTLAVRVRATLDAPLNADTGWADGDPVEVAADRPFRIRFEAAPGGADSLRLQVSRNGGPWAAVEAHDFPYPETATPRVSIVRASYSDGAGTTDVLRGSALPFAPGAGVSLGVASAARLAPDTHGEWEWPVVVRRFADGPVTNEPGDRFAFRLVDGAGRPVAAPVAEVALTVPAGHLGGTFVETPSRIGPWQASTGDLYVVMEPTETDNVMMVVTSEDGGATWREVDGAHRPAADDLEGVGTALVDGTLHVLHQTSERVWHHAFRTSEHPTAPDTWAFTDELVAAPGKPPTQVASLVAHPDGRLVAVYGGPQTVLLRTRDASGAWGDEVAVAPGGPVESGPHLALGAAGAVHLAYTDGAGRAWLRQLRPDGTLTPALLVADGLGTTEVDVGAVAPLAALLDGGVVVVYRRPDGGLWSRRAAADGAMSEPARVTDRAVVQNPVDSDQVGADVVVIGDRAHVLFIEEGTGHLYHASTDATGDWGPTRLVADNLTAQWVRGLPVTRADGTTVLGYVVDAGSDGGAGLNRFGAVGVGVR